LLDPNVGAQGLVKAPRLAALGIYLTLAVATSVPLSIHPSGVLPDNADALHFAWSIAWVCHQLPRDPLHLLSANIFYPDTASLAYGEPMLGEALLGWPIFALTGNDVITFNLLFVATLCLSAFTMFLLALEITDDWPAALLAGEIFAFTTANYDSAARLQIVSSQWTPLALLFYLRLLREGRLRNAVGLGIAFGLQGLACNYYQLFFATLLLLSLPAFLAAVERPRWRNTPWLGLALAGSIAVAICLPLDLAQLRHLSHIASERAVREGALPQTSYMQTAPQNWLYGASFGASASYDDRFFVGFATLLLLAAGVLATVPGVKLEAPEQARRWLIPFLAFGVLAFLLGCGKRLPFGDVRGPFLLLHSFVPGYAQTRVPSRYAMFVRLAIAVFAAVGFAALFARAASRLRRAAILALGVVVPLEHVSAPLPTWRVSSGASRPEVYKWLAESQERGPVVEFPPHPLRLRRQEAFFQHFSTSHWRPIVNGFSSFYPGFHDFLNELLLEDLPGDRSLRVLRGLGVRYVVFHPQRGSGSEITEAVDRFERFEHRIRKRPELGDQLELVKTFEPASYPDPMPRLGGERVYRVVGGPEGPRVTKAAWRPLGRDGWRCESAPASGDCRLAIDGRLDTVFDSQHDQGPGDFIRIAFPRGVPVVGVSLICGRYSSEYPRHVQILGLRQGRWLTLDYQFDELDFIRQVLETPERASMDLALEPQPLEALEVRIGLEETGFSSWIQPEIEIYTP